MIVQVNRGERARSDILDAAERLIAERGIQVPLRDIAVAAGQRNNSAVNYHFRNRQDLIDAIVRRRLSRWSKSARRWWRRSTTTRATTSAHGCGSWCFP